MLRSWYRLSNVEGSIRECAFRGCEFRTVLEETMRLHAKFVHKGVLETRSFVCSECREKFKTQKEVITHIKNHKK